MGLDVFNELQDFCDRNYYVDVADKLPIFITSIGAHLFNTVNKCSRCDFDHERVPEGGFTIPNCPLRHNNAPIYTPMSRLADTRVHILMRGVKGSGKNVLIDLFCAEGTGILWNPAADMGIGFRTMIGPNSITEAGMFGSVSDEGDILGRPLARETCGGFLCFEEFSSVMDATRKEHSVDTKNQLLTSLDSGRVNKSMRAGWVRYHTRYTVWGGTQPARFELESGLDRRFFVIDIEMTPDKEREYKLAQNRQANMLPDERAKLAEKVIKLREWFISRQVAVALEPPKGVHFSQSFDQWLMKPEVRSYESDLFRRIGIGYVLMQPDYKGGEILEVELDDRLKEILDTSLAMRRNVMDADLHLIRSAFWNKDLPKSTLLKEVAKMITMGDYQSAKRWVEENLIGRGWYREFTPKGSGGRGRKGVCCRFGFEDEREEGQA